ncbi:hypothetical protein QJQ45_003765 [Haematococcus lacustris]|nr:hypothetical protein QJQ45_003765 [Haematococcus lacustris]
MIGRLLSATSLRAVVNDATPRVWGLHAAHYAKKAGKQKGKKEDSEEADVEPPDLKLLARTMDAALADFQKELSKFTSGRVSPQMLEVLPVAVAEHKHVPLKSCATVAVRSINKLAVSPYQPAHLHAIAEALRTSPLKLQANVVGPEIEVPVPRPSLEMVSNTSKLASQEAVKWKHVISGMQARALDAINKGVPQEDARHRQLQEVKKMLTDRTKRIDELVKQKRAELEGM